MHLYKATRATAAAAAARPEGRWCRLSERTDGDDKIVASDQIQLQLIAEAAERFTVLLSHYSMST